MEELNLNKTKIQFTSSLEQIFASQGDVLLYSLNKSINLKSANKIYLTNEINTLNINQKGLLIETSKNLDIKSNDLLSINTNNGLKINLVGEKDFEINFLEDIQNFKIQGFQNDFLINEFKNLKINSKKILLNDNILIDKTLNIKTDVLINSNLLNFNSNQIFIKNKDFLFQGNQTNFQTDNLGFKTSKFNIFAEDIYFELNKLIFNSFQDLDFNSKNNINLKSQNFFINNSFKILNNQLLTNNHYTNFTSDKFKITSSKISIKNNNQKIKLNNNGLIFENILNLNFNIKGNSFHINENQIYFKSWDGIGIIFDSIYKPILFNSELIIKKDDNIFLEIFNNQINLKNQLLSLDFNKINILGDIYHNQCFKTNQIEVNNIYPQLLQTVELISGKSNLNNKILVNEKVKLNDVEEIGFETLNFGNVIFINENEFLLKKEKINIGDQILIGSGKFLIKPLEINNFEINTKKFLLQTDILEEIILRKSINTDIYNLNSKKINLSNNDNLINIDDDIKIIGKKIEMNNIILDDNVLLHNSFGKIFLEKNLLFEIDKSKIILDENEFNINVLNVNFQSDNIKIGDKFFIGKNIFDLRRENIKLTGILNINDVLKINKNFDLDVLKHEIKYQQSFNYGKETFFDSDKFILQVNQKLRIYNPHKSEILLNENINFLSKNITLEATENIYLNSNLITNNLKLNENLEYLGGDITFNTKGELNILMTKNILIESTTGTIELKTLGFNLFSNNYKTLIYSEQELTIRSKILEIESENYKFMGKNIEIISDKFESVLGEIKIEALDLSFYQTGKRGIKVLSDGGKIEIEGKEDIIIKTLFGDISIEDKNLTLSHDNILINSKKYQIESQEVYIDSSLKILGDFSLNGQFLLKGDTEILSDEFKIKNMKSIITTSEFLLDSQKNEINGSLKYNGNIKLYGDFEGEMKKSKFLLEGESYERGSFEVLEMSNHHLSSILLDCKYGGIELKSPEWITLNGNIRLKENEIIIDKKEIKFDGKIKIDVLEVNEIICDKLKTEKKEEVKPQNPYFKMNQGTNPINIRLDAQSYLKQGLKIFMENEKDIDEKVGIYVEGKGKNIICDGTIQTENIIFDFDGKKELKNIIKDLYKLVKNQEKKIEELENRLKN